MRRTTRPTVNTALLQPLEAIRVQFMSDRDVRNLLNAVLTAAIAATAADFGNIQLVAPEDGSLRIAAHQGFAREFLTFFRYVKDDPSACSAALRDGRRAVVRNVDRSPLYTETARRVMLTANARACQSTPIVGSEGRILGVISTHFRAPHRPTARQLASVDALARYTAGVLEALSRFADPTPGIELLVDAVRRTDSRRPGTTI